MNELLYSEELKDVGSFKAFILNWTNVYDNFAKVRKYVFNDSYKCSKKKDDVAGDGIFILEPYFQYSGTSL